MIKREGNFEEKENLDKKNWETLL